MTIQQWFSMQEKREFLTRHGYFIQAEEVTYGRSVYHNDVEMVTETVLCVYWDSGKEADHKPHWGGSPEQWVDEVFAEEMKKQFLKL